MTTTELLETAKSLDEAADALIRAKALVRAVSGNATLVHLCTAISGLARDQHEFDAIVMRALAQELRRAAYMASR